MLGAAPKRPNVQFTLVPSKPRAPPRLDPLDDGGVGYIYPGGIYNAPGEWPGWCSWCTGCFHGGR